MSDVALQLDESAVELGFADHLEAMANGYDWAIGDNGVAYLFKSKDPQELAHEAWLKEKEEVINSLDHLMLGYVEMGYDEQAGVLQHAIEFIRKGEC